MLRRIRLIVSDLDQTVFDSLNLRKQAFSEALRELSGSAARDVRIPDELDLESAYLEHGCHWVRGLAGVPGAVAPPDLELACRIQEVRLIEAGAGSLYPGVAAFFDSCRRAGAAWAVCSDSSRDYLLAVCDRFELSECLEQASCAEEYGSGGTDEMLEDALVRCEALAGEAVYLGTRPDSIEAARCLGLAPVACGWGLRGSPGFGGETISVRRVSDLGSCIARLDAQLASEEA